MRQVYKLARLNNHLPQSTILQEMPSFPQLQDVERQGNHTLPGVKEATEPDSDTTQVLEPSDRGFKTTMIKRLKWKMWTCSIRLVTSAERGKL